MVAADLHVHTTNSDGTLALGELPAAAERAGVGVVAVTDHDRLHPGLDPVAEREGITLVHGIELRVVAGGERVDLLGYGAEPTTELERELDRLQDDRIERARVMVERIEDRLGVDLDVDYRAGIGRPHVARAVADATDYDYGAVFEELIGEGCPCYVPRDVPGFETGRALLADACRLVGLAHPLRYDDPPRALELTADLDAIERYYPYDGDPDPAPVERAIERHDLLATGGSDAHDRELGTAGLDGEAFERFAAALPLPDP